MWVLPRLYDRFPSTLSKHHGNWCSVPSIFKTWHIRKQCVKETITIYPGSATIKDRSPHLTVFGINLPFLIALLPEKNLPPFGIKIWKVTLSDTNWLEMFAKSMPFSHFWMSDSKTWPFYTPYGFRLLWKKTLIETSRECHNQKPQPTPNTKMKKKGAKTSAYKQMQEKHIDQLFLPQAWC